MAIVRPGLCSITYRTLDPADIVARAARAGLTTIEWGSDVHARPDDHAGLARVRDVTTAAGLATCSYGTYFEAGETYDGEVEHLVAAAVALGAPRLRVWAGTRSSTETTAPQRQTVVGALRYAADVAATRDLEVALEFHAGSLTDTSESTIQLLEEIGRDNVTTYWQAPVGMSDADALDSLRAVADRVSAVHVFAWSGAGERHPLATRESFWREVFETLASRGFRGEALLEFVPDDDPDALDVEAETLRGVIR